MTWRCMYKCISLSNFNVLISMLNTVKEIGLLGSDFAVVWEKKPKLTMNKLGHFEFDNPQEVYGVVLTIWDDDTVWDRRFMLVDIFDDE